MPRLALSVFRFVHNPNVVVGLCSPVYRALREEIKLFSIRGNKRISIRILARERRHFRRSPMSVFESRNKNRPEIKVRSAPHEIDGAAVRCERGMRIEIAAGD